jgi:hypothetical protein
MEIGTVFCTDLEDGTANARLIAAAPELYEALEALAYQLKVKGLLVPPNVEAVLAKARGEK